MESVSRGRALHAGPVRKSGVRDNSGTRSVIVVNARRFFVVLPGILVLLSACTTTEPVELGELVEQSEEHFERLRRERNELEEPLTLYDALALGLERNLEFRKRSLDAALSRNNQRLASWEMLPSLTAEAGYNYRSPQSASLSKSVRTGRVSLAPSTAREQERTTGLLDLSWNMLDLGLAWYTRQQHGNEMLLAEEERVRMVHSVTRNIVHAWDQAVAYHQVRGELQQAREMVKRALDQSDRIAKARLRDPTQTLEYRKSLLHLMKEINRITGQMRQARAELRRMLNLPAGMDLELAESADMMKLLPQIRASREQWQLAALLHRPEARSVFYKKRMASYSAAERMLKLFPEMIFNFGYNYDSNEFLVDNQWRETGARISWNLLRLASWPQQKRQAELEQKKASVSARLQLTAVMSQVAIAGKRLQDSRQRHCISQQLRTIESQRNQIMSSRRQESALDQLTLVKAQMDLLLAKLESSLDRANYRRSILMLLSSSGLGITPATVEDADRQETAAHIRLWLQHGLEMSVQRIFEDVETHFSDISENHQFAIERKPCKEQG